MTTHDLQRITGVNGQTLRRMFEKKLLPAKRPPHGHWRIAKKDLAVIIKSLIEFGVIEEAPTKQRKK